MLRPRRLALLVGVDRYPLLKPESQLQSCANDARLMARVLRERFDFSEEGVRVLLNEASTKEAILAGLRALQRQAKDGDSVVFYYSGHGSRVRDTHGDEPDGWDETLVPHDSGRRPHPNCDVIDDDLYDWVLEVSAVTPYLTVIVDTCFSGTFVRRGPLPGEKWVEPDPRPLAAHGLRVTRARSRRRELGASGFLPVSDRYVLLAACRVDETAKELKPVPGGGEPHSAFTFFLCRELLRAPADATCREVLERTRFAVAAAVKAQTPQLEGARDRLVFGAKGSEPARYLLLEAREGSRAVLGGGAIHGVSRGSEWGIYPAGTRQTKGAKRLGIIRVGEVRAVSAEGEIVSETAPISPGARAFERSKGPDWMTLAVAVEAPELSRAAAADLVRRIKRSKLLRFIEEAERAEIRIQVLERNGGESHGAIHVEERSWVAIGRGDEPSLPPIPMSESGSTVRLIGGIEARARYLNLLTLADEDEGNPLRGCLDVLFLRRSSDGKFRPARPEKATGEIVYREGDYLALRISHHADIPLYLHLLDLGIAGGIDLIYPIAGANEALAPGQKLEIGVRAGQGIIVRIPEAFAAWSDAPRNQKGLECKEFLKVFATKEGTDLTWLRQPGFGEARAGQSLGSFGSLLRRALGGASRGDGSPSQAEPDWWTVATHAFLVRESTGRRTPATSARSAEQRSRSRV